MVHEDLLPEPSRLKEHLEYNVEAPQVEGAH